MQRRSNVVPLETTVEMLDFHACCAVATLLGISLTGENLWLMVADVCAADVPPNKDSGSSDPAAWGRRCSTGAAELLPW